MQSSLLSALALISIGVIGRLLPHVPNATPLTAIAASARERLGRWWAICIPLVAMLVADLVIGLYDWRILASVYVSVAVIGLMSHTLKEHSPLAGKLVYAGVASVLFFLVTNAAVWYFSPWYSKTGEGLVYCYLLGLPFLRAMLLGDIAFLSLFHAVEYRTVLHRVWRRLLTPSRKLESV